MRIKLKYQNVLRAEVSGFSESILERGLKGHSLVTEVLQEWEGIVNRVAKSKFGEKVIVHVYVVDQLNGGIANLKRRLC